MPRLDHGIHSHALVTVATVTEWVESRRNGLAAGEPLIRPFRKRKGHLLPQGDLLSQDVVWVDGGSVAGLLALWRLHGLDEILAKAWEAGVVLAGVSAGSICWHVGGPTDSFGPTLRPVTNALALLPYGNGVHYDSEAQRRPLLHRLVGAQTLPLSFATDDGAGLVYRGTELVEAVADRVGAAAYRIERTGPGEVQETVLSARLIT